MPPPGFEDEEEPLPAPFSAENKKRYNIIFIKSPNVARPTLIQPQQSEDKTIVYVLVKKPDDITQVAQPEIRHGKPEVFFIKYKAQTEQTPVEVEHEAAIQPQQTEDQQSQGIVVEDRSKQPSQAPQFPALEGKEAQALLREEEEKQRREEQQEQLQQAQQQEVLPAPLPSRTPPNAGISPLPIDFARIASSPAPPPQNYLPPRHQQ